MLFGVFCEVGRCVRVVFGRVVFLLIRIQSKFVVCWTLWGVSTYPLWCRMLCTLSSPTCADPDVFEGGDPAESCYLLSRMIGGLDTQLGRGSG